MVEVTFLEMGASEVVLLEGIPLGVVVVVMCGEVIVKLVVVEVAVMELSEMVLG